MVGKRLLPDIARQPNLPIADSSRTGIRLCEDLQGTERLQFIQEIPDAIALRGNRGRHELDVEYPLPPRRQTMSDGSRLRLRYGSFTGLVGGQFAQASTNGRHGACVDFAPPLMGFEHFSQQITAFKKGIDHLGAQAKLLLAYPIEQVFQNMRGVGKIGEPERTGAALDRVRSAEYGVELLRIRILDIEVEQQPLHRCQVLRRLVEEHLVELTHVDSHATPRARPPTHGDRKWNANGPILAWVSRLLPSRSPCARLQSVSADRTA